jgi:hypothetical protein
MQPPGIDAIVAAVEEGSNGFPPVSIPHQRHVSFAILLLCNPCTVANVHLAVALLSLLMFSSCCNQALTAEQQEKLAQAIAANSARNERAAALRRRGLLSMSTDCPRLLQQVPPATVRLATLSFVCCRLNSVSDAWLKRKCARAKGRCRLLRRCGAGVARSQRACRPRPAGTPSRWSWPGKPWSASRPWARCVHGYHQCLPTTAT